MPNSLRSKLSKLRYKRQISDEEYRELIKKLNGHDKELLGKIRAEIEQEYTIFRNKSDMWSERACGLGMALDIIDKHLKEVEE